MTSKQIRQQFLDFFESKQHLIVPSAPIVLKDDPTLMFNNSGMAQFKDFFLGYKKPTSLRIADTQKCLRVSGKHNDLDDVGKDTYHHTMFEMLGNWSFGDYFKKEAIEWAWELLTEVYKIPKENLYVTVFEGDEKDGTAQDDEALELWKKHIAEERILFGNKKDNFWEMGETGPCGPCSEIHVDIRSAEEKALVPGRDLVNQDHPQVIEVWNLVFMEYLRKADGSLEILPAKSIDTGMGFERLAMVLQGKTSNYDTDVFQPLIQELEKISGKKYGEHFTTDVAFRVVVDHLRAVSFVIADGQLPSNTGAGYVIRRILRRAISYGYRFLDLNEPFIYKLLPIFQNQMGEVFPELGKQIQLVTEVIKEEETSFLRTIDQGLIRLDNFIQNNSNLKEIPGEVVFELYDTYGFPADLSRIIAEEKSLTIDEKGFESEMEKQKQRSKSATSFSASDWTELIEDKVEEFIGYDYLEADVKITRYRKVENKTGTFYQLVFQATPFYAESGGQVGDTGYIESIVNGEKIEILNTKKENNLIVHFTEKLPKHLDMPFKAVVDKERRNHIMRNHSATHLLHEALREVLGTHVEQKGSYVGPDYLRFDFSHFNKMTEEELTEVSKQVNQKIFDRIPLEEKRSVPFKKALEEGAMALFGEKYGDVVRMVKFGDSIELCGGTHVENTADIILFKLKNESSSAAGIRRIEATTGIAAIDELKEIYSKYNEILHTLKNPVEPVEAVQKLLDENKELKSQLEKFAAQQAGQEKENWKKSFENKNGINFLAVKTSLSPENIKQIAFPLRKELENVLLIVASDHDGKPSITVAISDNLVAEKGLNAGQIVRDLGKEIQGGGGGQPFFATAGGKDVSGLERALEKAKNLI
ncbi:alanine--tRNA ligase [Moheibacter lacus]|uniref:Alanine--tRNA ligase n=1 Tax=Moheibacter lacus TaxID=2745851 RepID=A0A838ZRC4_9FLAO|nr:alanine--tRNA ligase [Moheibacter lacus]MBA5628992.1 alanine--tRNA ligase [Moheibacter lacus]